MIEHVHLQTLKYPDRKKNNGLPLHQGLIIGPCDKPWWFKHDEGVYFHNTFKQNAPRKCIGLDAHITSMG